jgi:hypothetical protein
MRGRDFLELARDLLPGTLPRHWRGIVIHAYYALLLECRDTMTGWGLPALQRHQVHSQVRLRLTYATNADLKQVGYDLEDLSRHRNRANYELQPLAEFATPKLAHDDVKKAADAITLLDSIDNDPVRRAAAIASIRP